jgi:hypothetical protein
MIVEIASIITAIATATMAVVAWVALRTWRKEFIGKKKIGFACQIMKTVCEIQDALIYARLNRISSNEIKEVEAWMKSEKERDPRDTEIYPDRFHFLIANRRLMERQDKIDKLKEIYNEAFLYFGEDIFRLLYELYKYTVDVRDAAHKLYYNVEPENQQMLYGMICAGSTNDPMDKRVDDIVKECKLNLEPLYKDQQMSWKKLKI